MLTTFDYNIVKWNCPVIAFENGADGITLLQTLTSASSDITSATYTSALKRYLGDYVLTLLIQTETR
jgi:hypothetical protein